MKRDRSTFIVKPVPIVASQNNYNHLSEGKFGVDIFGVVDHSVIVTQEILLYKYP
jgi:hypothetical protein